MRRPDETRSYGRSKQPRDDASMGWDPKKRDEIEMECPKERGKANFETRVSSSFWMWSPLFLFSIISLLLLDDDDFDDTTEHIDDTD